MAIGWLTPECRWRQRSHDRGISTVEEIWNMTSERKKRVSHQVMKSEWAGSVEVSELYCDSLFKESVVQRDVREGVEGNVRAEVRGVRDARWNRVSPDIYPPSREWCPNTVKGEEGQNGMESKITVLMWQGAAGCLWWKFVTSSGAWMLSQGSHELCSIPMMSCPYFHPWILHFSWSKQ